MSFLTDNKQQLVHIASEIVLFAGVIYYFDKKHKTLLNVLEQLVEKINEQNNIISLQDSKLNQLSETITFLSDELDKIKSNPNLLSPPQPPPRQMVQPPPQMVQTPPQMVQPPPQMVQTPPQMVQPPEMPQPPTQTSKSHVIPIRPKMPKVPKNNNKKKPSVSFKTTPPPPPIEEESDLDAELCEELEELEDQESADEINLLDEDLKKSLD